MKMQEVKLCSHDRTAVEGFWTVEIRILGQASDSVQARYVIREIARKCTLYTETIDGTELYAEVRFFIVFHKYSKTRKGI